MATLEQLIVTALMTPRTDPQSTTCVWGLPVNIVGLSGCGKSERVVEACRILQLPYQVLFLASKQPEDIGGAPCHTPDGIVMECILPQANKLMHAGTGVLFIDELSTARPAVQAAALGLVNDRRVGDHLLPPRVRILCAMNPAEYAAGGFTLEAPLANRMLHFSYEVPTSDQWVDWLIESTPQSLPTITGAEQMILSGWGQQWSHVRGLLVGFMKAKGNLLHMQPKPDDPNAGGPWPSHRMWNWAGRAVAAARCLNMPPDLDNQLVQGCVGEGVMVEWATWVANNDLPAPEDMLTKGWKPDRSRLDITIGALASMSLWIKGLQDKTKQTNLLPAAWELIQRTIDEKMPDLAVRPAATLVTAGLANTHKDPRVKEACKEPIRNLGKGGFSRFQGVAV
jgi:hypothetical protein